MEVLCYNAVTRLKYAKELCLTSTRPLGLSHVIHVIMCIKLFQFKTSYLHGL